MLSAHGRWPAVCPAPTAMPQAFPGTDLNAHGVSLLLCTPRSAPAQAPGSGLPSVVRQGPARISSLGKGLGTRGRHTHPLTTWGQSTSCWSLTLEPCPPCSASVKSVHLRRAARMAYPPHGWLSSPGCRPLSCCVYLGTCAPCPALGTAVQSPPQQRAWGPANIWYVTLPFLTTTWIVRDTERSKEGLISCSVSSLGRVLSLAPSENNSHLGEKATAQGGAR